MEQSRILLARVQNGRPEKSMLLTGLRGVGKTVLLNEMARKAEELGYKTIAVEAHEKKTLAALLAPHLRSLLYQLHRMEGAKDKIRRGRACRSRFTSSSSTRR